MISGLHATSIKSMPRQSRIDAPGALHHIIARGIERKKIFQDSVDRDNFLNRLGNILTETQTTCFSWALLPNHFHFIAANGNHINFYCNAQAFDRLRSVLQFSASPAWTSFSEPLQIHFVSGRFLSPGTRSIYPFKSLKSRHVNIRLALHELIFQQNPKFFNKRIHPNIFNGNSYFPRWSKFSTAFGLSDIDPVGCFIASAGKLIFLYKRFQQDWLDIIFFFPVIWKPVCY
jgi:REP element-mobilizing transposase RayT